MSDRRRLLQSILRQSLSPYVHKVFAALEPGNEYLPNWHIDHVCWNLTRVARGECRRLIITVPPRSMKSITVSVGFTSWVLGHWPNMRIICVSYSDSLARKLALDTRIIMENEWYRELFPRLELSPHAQRMSDLRTTQHGYRFAAGMNGAVLGRGADLIVIDDPIKASDAFSLAVRRRVNQTFDNTLLTRLNDKTNGAIVIIMQRLHEDDLVGHVLGKSEWEFVNIPAIETEDRDYRLSDDPSHLYSRKAGEVLHAAREPLAILEEVRRAQGSLVFSAQYQQAPIPPEGNIVKRSWIVDYDRAPTDFDLVIASWDTASTILETADYSVGTVWGAKGLSFYLLDVVRGRFEVPHLRREIVATSRQWNADQTIIEDGDMGRAIVQDLRRDGHFDIILKRVRGDKQARFLAQSARFESGQVHVRQTAAWYADWLNELLAFPNGRHDDQVDSTSQALNYLSGRMLPVYAQAVQERPNPRRPVVRRRSQT